MKSKRFSLAEKDDRMSEFDLHFITCRAATSRHDAAGYLNNSNGSLNNRGSNGNYWSSTQNSSTNGWNLNFNSGNCNMNNNNKANGFSSRCLRDSDPYRVPNFSIGDFFL